MDVVERYNRIAKKAAEFSYSLNTQEQLESFREYAEEVLCCINDLRKEVEYLKLEWEELC